ncbi:hypothetical protein NBRC10512_000977 [Rhodotorula toruloides]|uniref:RHTO0S17e03422g1_1 n=2 Tax=Rhodotorula toruloides TaxID=5286 RepID=A0A061BKG4_RHOTO|nr:uncharacterized protein RHTO_03451 [Rhodotorula toruloides NP11]EMS20532.1 hypothetical protein RHTO_03451 [Rhodotorula toruloides NP11]CDR48430.1 RHTO0S17e03422g1_1 [Rhodotorula toruloides]
MTSQYALLPTKEPIPSSPSSTSSTDPAHPSPSSTKHLSDSYSPPTRPSTPSTRHAILRALLTTLACCVAGFVVGGTGLVLLAPDVAGRAWSGLSCHGAESSDRVGGLWKRQAAEGGGAGAEYSTTTYEGGKGATSTFVKTTRPIVNPGGYTIGTLTGFVPVSTTTLPASPSTSSSSDSSSASSASMTNETTTSSIPAPTSTADSTSETSETVSEPAFTRSNPFVHPISTAPFASSISPVSVAPERRLFKRQSPSDSSLTATATGKEEFRTSIDARPGRETTVTLVKTTRPIVNAGGYTIGTLDGAWVDVAKQTDRPSASSPPPSFASSSASSSLSDSPPSSSTASATMAPDKRAHEELRRRNVVHLAAE